MVAAIEDANGEAGGTGFAANGLLQLDNTVNDNINARVNRVT